MFHLFVLARAAVRRNILDSEKGVYNSALEAFLEGEAGEGFPLQEEED